MRWWFLTAISDLYLYIMNNMRFIFLCCVVLNSFLLFGQDDYNELSDSKYVDLEVWRKQKDDLCISWGMQINTILLKTFQMCLFV